MLIPLTQPASPQLQAIGAKSAKKMTDEEIIGEILENGRTDLFGILYLRYSGKVYRKCLSFSKDPDLAKDMAQDVMVKLFHQLQKYSGRSKFSTWLYAITYNYCVEQYRKSSRYHLQELNETCDLHDHDEDHEPLKSRSRHLARALRKIKEDDRDILVMKYQQDLSIKELTERFNISDSAVKMRLARARNRVKAIISESEKQVA